MLRKLVLLWALGLWVLPLGAFAQNSCSKAFEMDGKSAHETFEALRLSWIEKQASEVEPGRQRLQDVVQREGFKIAALNMEVLRAHTSHYTHTLPVGKITDQGSSGRCWIYAGLNMIRSQLIREKKVDPGFEFSESYLHFFSMLERSHFYLNRLFAAQSGKNRISKRRLREEVLNPGQAVFDGGWFETFQFLVKKYGLVPKAAMPETASTRNTSIVLAELHLKLVAIAERIQEVIERRKPEKGQDYTQDQIEDFKRIKAAGMEEVYQILETHFGRPPKQFEFTPLAKKEDKPTDAPKDTKDEKKEGEKVKVDIREIERFTPQQFAHDWIGFKAEDYVAVTNSPLLRAGKSYHYEERSGGPTLPKEAGFNFWKMLNVSPERYEQLVIDSIESGRPLWFAADVRKDMDLSNTSITKPAAGILHLDLLKRDPLYGFEREKSMDHPGRKARYYYSEIQLVHAMAITAFDRPNPAEPVVKYRVENSWSDKMGDRGFLHMYRGWFHQHSAEIIVHKSLLTSRERKAFEGPSKYTDLF